MTVRSAAIRPAVPVRAGFFLLLALESLGALAALALIPPDPKNSLILGYSLNRLALMLAALLSALATGWLALRAAHHPAFFDRLLRAPRLTILLSAAAALIALAAWLALVFLRAGLEGGLMSTYARLRPLLLLAIAIGLEIALWLLVERRGLHPELLPAALSWLRPAGIACIALAALLAFMLLTGIGVTPDLYAWNSAGIPLLAWQVAGVCLLGGLLFWNAAWSRPLALENANTRRLDAALAGLVYLLAAGLWLSQPVQPSYYAPLRPPNDAFYPYSDASYYDLAAQHLLVGNGYLSHTVVTRPLYILFLALSHLLAGQDYQRVVVAQTLLLALFPVCLYALGRLAHSRAAGLILAGLAILRELNAFAATPLTEVSHSKLFLTDLPTALGVAVFCLLVMLWFVRPDRRWMPLLAGGGLGFLMLTRAQAGLFLPFVLLAALWIYRRRWRRWLEACLLVGLGLGLVLAPWVARNTLLTGKVVFDQSTNQTIIFGQRYSKTDNDLPAALPGETGEQFSARMLDSAKEFALQNPGYTARFIGDHFLNNEVATLGVLPFHVSFDDPADNWTLTSVFWDGIFTRLTAGETALLALYLVFIAVGLGAAWRRLGMAGLVPLLLNLVYSLSNAVARNSGWRYILPVDWAGFFYFALGLLAALTALLALLGGRSQPVQSLPVEPSLPFPRRALIGAGVALLALAAVIPLAELAFPTRFPPEDRQRTVQNLQAALPPAANVDRDLLQQFAVDPNTFVLHGQTLYPRFYRSGQGEIGSGWPAFAIREGSRMAFFVLDGDRHWQVLLPVVQAPAAFPNAAEVYIIGCRPAGQDVLEARWAFIPGRLPQLFASSSEKPYSCP